jgi:hypothetical protein
VNSDEIGMRRFDLPDNRRFGTRAYEFPGGCVTYRFTFAPGADISLLREAEAALTFQPRVTLVTEVWERSGGLSLCGAMAPC